MKQIALDIGLSSGPTLHNFHPGPNQLAHAHLRLWLGPGGARAARSPVPIYLWGASGSGKTHLLIALREALREQGEQAGWMDAGAADPGPFREDWTLVLLDDVQRYGAVRQQAAFNWFIHAQAQQCCVIASGDCVPSALPLREDLRTRLGWGHVFGLRGLSEPECRAVLRQAADARGVFLGDEVMDFMLTRFSRDLASLMELLDLIDAYAMRTKRAITVPMIRAMMEES